MLHFGKEMGEICCTYEYCLLVFSPISQYQSLTTNSYCNYNLMYKVCMIKKYYTRALLLIILQLTSVPCTQMKIEHIIFFPRFSSPHGTNYYFLILERSNHDQRFLVDY